MQSSTFGNLLFVTCYLLLNACAHAQTVETLDLATSEVHPITARLGNACLVQLPVEPVATNVGDPLAWLVEKTERLVSVKPIQPNAKDTNLAVVTRQGTLNFAVHFSADSEPFTQIVRVTRIIDDSKPLPPMQDSSQETLAEAIIREIRISQNYYALKQVNAPELREVEQITQMYETGGKTCSCNLLQTFRFRNTRHIVLHFLTQNRVETPVTFDPRRTIVSHGDTFFTPTAVSMGRTTLPPKGNAENFIVLDGANGLSPRQKFNIYLAETPSPAKSR